MKTFKKNWNELLEDKLNKQEMIKVRGGNTEDEDPVGPIVK